MTAPRWTEAELSRAEAMRGEGWAFDAIAAEMGRSGGPAVRNALLRHGRTPAPSRRPWTPHELAQAEALRAEGWGYDAIARELGRSSGWTVMQAMRRHRCALGATRPRMTDGEVRRARQMRDRGLTYVGIGRALGRRPDVVRQRLVSLGEPIGTPRREWTTGEIRRARALRDQGLSYEAVAGELGREPEVVRRRLRRAEGAA